MQYLKLGVMYFAYYLCTQLADSRVNGNLQACLFQILIPATGVVSYWLLGSTFSTANIAGSVLVIGGCLMVAVPPVRDTAALDMTDSCAAGVAGTGAGPAAGQCNVLRQADGKFGLPSISSAQR